ncbi:MauE/DoxX family redox-associated membrane protein [Streptomyces sp. MS2.AVA.5]|uniref:MauE/DoxX family redox-associated membrane protein n=1 Tax=Streptomyces achmelvichensis TaxID=3134111 RepID=A0ACC6PSA2_9ACTN
MSYLVFACRILLFGVFFVALFGKVRSRSAFHEFARSIVELRLFSRRTSRRAAGGVAVTEVAVLVLLVPTQAVWAGFALATALLLAFTSGILIALHGGRRGTCRCFGASAAPLSMLHVVRNLILAAVGVSGFVAMAAASPNAVPSHAGGAVVVSAAALVTVLVVVRLDDLAALFTTRPAIPAAQARAGNK